MTTTIPFNKPCCCSFCSPISLIDRTPGTTITFAMPKISGEAASRVYPAAYLHDFCTQVFMHFGVPRADAEQAADVLAKSDLRGIDSHGVARLHTYFEMLELGRINPKPKIEIVREK